MSRERRAVVVGAGIVGVCTGLALRERGWKVTIVDRLAPGEGCSFGNAGILASHAVVPTALPGLLRQVPRMLLDPQGPLVLRWASLPSTWSWLLRFCKAANIDRVHRSADAMKALYGSSVELHQALARQAGVPELVRTRPGLYVHRDPAGIDLLNGLAWRLRRERGAQIEVLNGAALRDAEPALSPTYQRGVRMGPMGYTTNPYRLTTAYAALFAQLGGAIVRAEVRALRPTGDLVRIETGSEVLDADAVIVAAGAWSLALVKPLGLKLPLVAERGYHMTFADPGLELNHVVSEIELHYAVTSMEPGLRIAGTEEIGLADDAPSWRRADVLHGHARRMFPGARLEAGTRWMGPRPGTPDNLPAIGPLPGHPNIFIAAGHGHLGLTGGPNTGRIVAGMMSGEPAAFDMTAFAPGRFGA
jgi:D-amino-acid dehydrogenase